jgi:hypothetical protein
MDARMSGGPSTIAEDAASDVAGEEAGVERRTEDFPFHSRLVLCEAAKGIVPCWMGQPRRPAKAIRGRRKTGALPMLLRLVEGKMTDERMAGWMCETARVRMEKLHDGWTDGWMSNER